MENGQSLWACAALLNGDRILVQRVGFCYIQQWLLWNTVMLGHCVHKKAILVNQLNEKMPVSALGDLGCRGNRLHASVNR